MSYPYLVTGTVTVGRILEHGPVYAYIASKDRTYILRSPGEVDPYTTHFRRLANVPLEITFDTYNRLDMGVVAPEGHEFWEVEVTKWEPYLGRDITIKSRELNELVRLTYKLSGFHVPRAGRDAREVLRAATNALRSLSKSMRPDSTYLMEAVKAGWAEIQKLESENRKIRTFYLRSKDQRRKLAAEVVRLRAANRRLLENPPSVVIAPDAGYGTSTK